MDVMQIDLEIDKLQLSYKKGALTLEYMIELKYNKSRRLIT